MTVCEVKILDGKWLASQVHRAIRKQVEQHQAARGRPPGLAVILVGDNPASHAYVGTKSRVAKECGFATFDARLPAASSEREIADAIQGFNLDKRVDGILLQLPLPAGIDSHKLIDLIDTRKDADGLHPYNQGLLMRGEGSLRPCTPLGSMKLIDLAYSGIVPGAADIDPDSIPPADLAGKRAIVVGRSILVGKPIALMLLERNATVVMGHSKTPELGKAVHEADLVVAAVGRPHLVRGEWIKQGAVVIDVGINRLADGSLTGDVEFAAAQERASAITPVPRGVGPMTVAMLMRNTFTAYMEGAK